MNALRVLRTRPATSAVNLVTSRVIALTHPLTVVLVVVAASLLVVAALVVKSATSAPRLAILLVTALRLLVVMVAAADMVVTKVAMVADSVVVKAVKPATPVVATAICLVIALKDKSATTVARLAIFPETAHPRPALSVLATSASNPDTFRLSARTKPSRCLRQLIH